MRSSTRFQANFTVSCPWCCNTSAIPPRRSALPSTWCCGARPSRPRRWPRSATPCWGASIPLWNPGCASSPPCGCRSPARRSPVLDLKVSSLTCEQLAEWDAQKERLEAELARQIPEMNLEQKLRAADRRAVALGLPEGVALVEFVRFPVFDFQAVPARGEPQWKPARYVAFVLPGGEPDDVQMIDLGEAEPIDRLIADFRAGIIAEAETDDGRDMAKRREEAASDRRERCRLGPASGPVRPAGSGPRRVARGC